MKMLSLALSLLLAPVPALAQNATDATAPAAEAPAQSVPAPAPTPAPPPPPPPPAIPPVKVAMQTSAGVITIELDREHAPVTAANFLRYADQKRFDGTTFYRAMKLGDGGLIQGGTRGDPKRRLPPIAHEPTTKTGLSHVEGAISMARFAPGSATGDFFIILGTMMRGLDADPKLAGDNAGFAVFGRVVDGMDVVRKIQASPTSPTAGEGAMKGQILSPTIRIISVRRVK